MGLWSRLFGGNEFDTTVTDHQSTVAGGVVAGAHFRMSVVDVFTITGRGTVVTGTVESGMVRVGDPVSVGSLPATVRGIEMFRKTTDTAEPGQSVGLLIEGVARDAVSPGTVVVGR